MKIYYREKSGGIEILRCFGIEGRVEIPGMIDGKLVISVAPYAFSSHMDEKEDLKNASLWEVSDGLEFGREEHVLGGDCFSLHFKRDWTIYFLWLRESEKAGVF